MAEARFISRTDSGLLQLSNKYFSYYLAKKTRVDISLYNTIFTKDADTEFIAFQPVNSANYVFVAIQTTTLNQNDVNIRLSNGYDYITGQVDIYQFKNPKSLSSLNYKGKVRFNLYNEFGEIIFAGTAKPLKIAYAFSGDVQISGTTAGHLENTYVRSEVITQNLNYALGFSSFFPSFLQKGKGQDFGNIEIVARTYNGKFETQQRFHRLGTSSSGEGSSLKTFGSTYISHLVVDVTNF